MITSERIGQKEHAATSDSLIFTRQRSTSMKHRIFHSLFGNWSVKGKVACILFWVLVFPTLMALVFHGSSGEHYEGYLAVYLAFSIILLVPLSHLISSIIVLKDIREINAFCKELRRGNYNVSFELPAEEDEEHDLLRLKRNMSWMAHVIASREGWLQTRLEESSEDKKAFERLSFVDALTQVYNRRYFEKEITTQARDAETTKGMLFLMLLDADGFKQINDELGHQVGDELLCRLGAILNRSVRNGSDTPFRYGGDEFGVIFTGVKLERVRDIGERIRMRFLVERIGQTTLSIGIAQFKSHPDGLDEAIKDLKQRADEAVYMAKHNGKNQVIVHPEDAEW